MDEHLLDQPGRVYEPKPWRKGKNYGAVVSDEVPPGNRLRSIDAADHIESYGGILVAESIAPCNNPVIRAAPELLALVRDMIGKCYVDVGNIRAGEELLARIDAEVRAALSVSV